MTDHSTDPRITAHGDQGDTRAGADTATPATDTVEVDPQNPDPAVTAGLTEGGGVDPGDTPPVSSSVGGPHHEPPQRTLAMPVIAITLVALLAVLIAAGLLGRIAGLF
jgi:hypothetical protein